MYFSFLFSVCVFPIWYTLFQSGYHIVFIKYFKIITIWFNKSHQNSTFLRTFLLVLDRKKTCTDTWLSNVSIVDVILYHYSEYFLSQHAWDQVKFPSRSSLWKKHHLKRNEVIYLTIPNYKELSVKNLYEDAMQDQVLSKYLPTKEQLSGKLPERDFFFGILSTLKNQYMLDVIKDANEKRFKP